jgi:hypothetical protein
MTIVDAGSAVERIELAVWAVSARPAGIVASATGATGVAVAATVPMIRAAEAL